MNLTEIIYFVVSTSLINMGLNVFKFIPFVKKIDRPLDLSKIFIDKRRILGPSTTFLGLFFALIYGFIVGLAFYTFKIGLTLGLLVYLGHLLGSFMKRRLNIPPGEALIIIDQSNYIITTGSFMYLIDEISLTTFLVSILITVILHPFVCVIGFKLKVRSKPY